MKTHTLALLFTAVLALGTLPGCAGESKTTEERPEKPAGQPAALAVGDMFTIPSGQRGVPDIAVEVVDVGAGPRCGTGRRATVDYIGTFADGREFDRSRDKGVPFTFLVGPGGAIQGWHLVAEQMRVGDRWNVVIPYQLAYGEQGRGPIGPRTDLNFDMELLGIR